MTAATNILDTLRSIASNAKAQNDAFMGWARELVSDVLVEVNVLDFEVVYVMTDGREVVSTTSYNDARRMLSHALSN